MPPSLEEDPDTVLVDRCKRGDAAAWAALVQRYQRLVYAVARRGGLDEHGAADVFQTVFARLIEHLPRLSQPDRLQAWLVTTAKREVIRLSQLSRRTVSLSGDGNDSDDGPTAGLADHLADETPLAEEQLSDLQQLHRLRLAMERLDERCNRLLQLVFHDEDERLPYDEVGRRLGMPTGSIGPTRVRCLDKLRQLMAVMAGSGAA